MNPIRFVLAPLRRLRNKLDRRPDIDRLVRRGVRLGTNVTLQFGVVIDHSYGHLIAIGDDSIVAPNVHIIAHDASTKLHIGYAKIARVTIGKRVFVGAQSIVLPGVTIGDDAIVAAGSVVTRSVPARTIVGGNPARIIGSVDDFIARNTALLAQRPAWPIDGWHVEHGMSEHRKQLQWEALDGPGFLE